MAITNYYRQTWVPAGVDPNILEKSLGINHELNAQRALDRLVEAPDSLTSEDIADITSYIGFQRLRVPRQAAMAKALFQQALLATVPPEIAESIHKGSQRIVIHDSYRFEYMKILVGAATPWLSRMIWELVESPPGCTFLTTDSPVSYFNVDLKPPLEAGLGLAGTQVWFPLRPSMLLFLRHPEYDSLQAGENLVRLPEPEPVDRNIEIRIGGRWDAEHVGIHNQAMIHLANRYAVSKDRSDLQEFLAANRYNDA